MIQTDYYLKHKNDTCGLVRIDPADGKLLHFSIKEPQMLPFLGSADQDKMKQWWVMRAVPGSRKTTQELIRQAGCNTSYEYLAKNLALSLTDCYWLCPIEEIIRWEDINLYNVKVDDAKLAFHNATSYDPNASLGGQMEKYWDLSRDHAMLVKQAYQHHGQQSLNEELATRIHERQPADIPYVSYITSRLKGGGVQARCDAFTSEDVEFVSAYEAVESAKKDNAMSMYDTFIAVCEQHGMDRKKMQCFMDYQTLTDFVLSNTDEHLMNFGILRNSNTMELIGPAPIFDSGNSMFYADERTRPYDRASILERKITSFHDSEERMLSHVKNKKIVDMSCLPTPDEIEAFYIAHKLSSKRAAFIAKNYEIKLDLLKDFQAGRKVSLYLEKKSTKKHDKK